VGDFEKVLTEMPLAYGGHKPGNQACLMEKVAILWALHSNQDVTEVWSDLPECTNEIIARAAQRANDVLADTERQRLNTLIPRLLRARRTDSDRRINVRLAVFAGRSVLHLVRDEDRAVALQAIEAAEAWLENPIAAADAAPAAAAADAANPVYYAYRAAVYAAAAAANAAAADAAYANTTAANTYTTVANTYAYNAVSASQVIQAADANFDPVQWLDQLLDAWEEAITKEGEDLYVPREWEDEALAFVDEYMTQESGRG
jgi:hypothetical protein